MNKLNINKLKRLSFTDKLAISGYVMLAISLVGFKIYMATGEKKNLFEPGYKSGPAFVASKTSTSPTDSPFDTGENPDTPQYPAETTPRYTYQARHRVTNTHVPNNPQKPHNSSNEKLDIEEDQEELPSETTEPPSEPPIISVPPVIEPPHENPEHDDVPPIDEHEGET